MQLIKVETKYNILKNMVLVGDDNYDHLKKTTSSIWRWLYFSKKECLVLKELISDESGKKELKKLINFPLLKGEVN